MGFLHMNWLRWMCTRILRCPNPSVPQLSSNSWPCAETTQSFSLETPIPLTPTFLPTLPHIPPKAPQHLSPHILLILLHLSPLLPCAPSSPAALILCSSTAPLLLLLPALVTHFPAIFLPGTASHYGHPSSSSWFSLCNQVWQEFQKSQL